jgi:hypothetical protein
LEKIANSCIAIKSCISNNVTHNPLVAANRPAIVQREAGVSAGSCISVMPMSLILQVLVAILRNTRLVMTLLELGPSADLILRQHLSCRNPNGFDHATEINPRRAWT